MLFGRLTKLFLLKSNCSNKAKKSRSWGIVPSERLQLLRTSFTREHKFTRGGNCKHVEFGSLVCNNGPSKDQQVFGVCPVHSWEDNFLRVVECPMEDGSCLIAVPPTSSSSKHFISSKSSGSLSIFEQSLRLRIMRDFKPHALLGKCARRLQFLKFSTVSRCRNPTDW
ncbi:hypothetical protein ACOSQ3_009228 [Xanthoceras sorbifolium]